MALDEVAYLPYADPDDFIREVTDLIWVNRAIGHIRQNCEPDSIVHGSFGTAFGRDQVIEGTTTRLAATWVMTGRYVGMADYGPLTGSTVQILGLSQFLVQQGRIVREVRVYDDIATRAQIAGARGDEPLTDLNIH